MWKEEDCEIGLGLFDAAAGSAAQSAADGTGVEKTVGSTRTLQAGAEAEAKKDRTERTEVHKRWAPA